MARPPISVPAKDVVTKVQEALDDGATKIVIEKIDDDTYAITVTF